MNEDKYEELEYEVLNKNGDNVGVSFKMRVNSSYRLRTNHPPHIVKWRGRIFILCGPNLEYYQEDSFAEICEAQVNYGSVDPNTLSLFD